MIFVHLELSHLVVLLSMNYSYYFLLVYTLYYVLINFIQFYLILGTNIKI